MGDRDRVHRGGGDGRIEVGYFQGCSADGSSSERDVESCLQNNGVRRLYSGRCYCLKKNIFGMCSFHFLRREGAFVPRRTDNLRKSCKIPLNPKVESIRWVLSLLSALLFLPS